MMCPRCGVPLESVGFIDKSRVGGSAPVDEHGLVDQHEFDVDLRDLCKYFAAAKSEELDYYCIECGEELLLKNNNDEKGGDEE